VRYLYTVGVHRVEIGRTAKYSISYSYNFIIADIFPERKTGSEIITIFIVGGCPFSWTREHVVSKADDSSLYKADKKCARHV
jgi:hypothetical protein